MKQAWIEQNGREEDRGRCSLESPPGREERLRQIFAAVDCRIEWKIVHGFVDCQR